MDTSEFLRRLNKARRDLFAFNVIVFLISCLLTILSFRIYLNRRLIGQLLISIIWVVSLIVYLTLNRTKIKSRYNKYIKIKNRKKVRKLLLIEIIITLALLGIMPLFFSVQTDYNELSNPIGFITGIILFELFFMFILLIVLSSSDVISKEWIRD